MSLLNEMNCPCVIYMQLCQYCRSAFMPEKLIEFEFRSAEGGCPTPGDTGFVRQGSTDSEDISLGFEAPEAPEAPEAAQSSCDHKHVFCSQLPKEQSLLLFIYYIDKL